MLVHASGRHHRPEDLQLSSSSSANIFPQSYSLSPHPSNTDSPYYPADFGYSSRQSTPSDQSSLSPTLSPYMTTTSSHNPPICVQSSTPNLVSQQYQGAFSSMPENYSAPGANWDYNNNYHLSPQLQQDPSPVYRRHRRFPSDTTIGSTGPDSPYTHTQGLAYPYIVDPDSVASTAQQLEALDGAYSATQYPKAASAPAQYPYDNFFAPPFNNYNPSTYNAESLMATQAAMKQALRQHSGHQNMSGGLPSERSYGEAYDGSVENRNNVPKFDRTMTDIYQDELYQPTATQSVPTSQARTAAANQPSLLSPYNTVFNERLQEANKARSASPSSSISRVKSPFRETSDFATDGISTAASNPHSPATRLNSAVRMREQAKAESDAIAMVQHQPRKDALVSPNTISPKEVSLDSNETEEDAKMPLFPQESRHKRSKQLATGNTKHETHDTNSIPKQDSTSYASSQPGATYTFMPPSVPPQQYPFMARRQSSIRSTSDNTIPEFPAHLTSMESTRSESSQSEPRVFHGLPSSADSSQQSQSSSSPVLQRPSNTAAESGTYTCVAPSCAARFDTAAKLQKHRRDTHPASPRTPATQYAPPSNSAANTPTSATFPNASSANRNQQSGPHRCERVNPSTGKPCNTVFSRSYDLTRHEDTIHNGRKQKVRCRLCTEEKTFSRNDALTRHMRVVHPEVDFPGKKARRGG